MSFRKKEETILEIFDTTKKTNIRIMRFPEREERKREIKSLFKEIKEENSPHLRKELNIPL